MTPILPWIAHLYTATGAVIALLATGMTFAHNFRAVFIYFIAATFVDSTDGVLARALQVKERLPNFDGAKLDDIIDYLMYAFIPALVVWQADMVPSPFPICAAIVLSSAYGFAQADAKVASTDHFFTGFPSYWNIVVAYLFVLQLSPDVNAVILLGFAAMVFVPIRYIYPSRTSILPRTTNLLGAVWGTMGIGILWQYPQVSRPLVLASLAYPVYYFVLSFVVHTRTSPARNSGSA